MLQQLPQYELAAVATTRRATADAAAAEFNVPSAYDNFSELVQQSDVDLVVVNTRAPEHFVVAQAAIDAGKHVYCEWPLTTNTIDSTTLLDAASQAGIRHAVGLQRRMAASSRYLRELLEEGYVGQVRSLHLHVSEPTFYRQRADVLAFTAPGENFSSVLSIYGGHFLDMLFWISGWPNEIVAVTTSQFDEVTLTGTNEVIPSSAPDQLLISGTYTSGAVLSVHVEGGKRNGFGVRLEITGTDGDLRLTYGEAFSNTRDGRIEGTQGERQPMVELAIPERLQWAPQLKMGGSVRELGNLYAALAADMAAGTSNAPTFADALPMHQFLDLVEESSKTGRRAIWNSKLDSSINAT
ncbi:putative oxidoreductase, mmyg [Blastopirellula marina DSM 3645]|uniref:Putative oxidoreductase, mmyg n=1 Tax=Blastopirellula marina DSM 3645 TaxID=314230 RepID=A3ZP11_9BACT|nr:putative oxidoreductase, mmyg [Blastopirellula marina DSM 3645]